MNWFKMIALLLMLLFAILSLVSCNGTVVYHDDWRPGPGPNWVPGHWSWGGGDWVWIGGHWRP
jgi:hypothetical protein